MRSMVEGQAAPPCEHDCGNHCVHVSKHVGSVEPQNLNSYAAQPSVAPLIIFRPGPHRMAVAVHLDDELGRGAIEVRCAAVERMLVAKLQAIRAGAQNLPEQAFWQAHLATKGAGSQHCGILPALARYTRHYPSTTLRVVPLPIRGWGGTVPPRATGVGRGTMRSMVEG
jgi:hypothetical protein